MKTFPDTESTAQPLGRVQFARLVQLRWLSVGCMALAAFALPPLLGIELPQAHLLAVALVLAAANLFSIAWAAYRPAHGAPVLFGQLAADLAGWSVFLYFSGGATNPLISLLLPLVAIGAAILPAALGWLLAALAVAAYSLLWHLNRPVAFHNHADAMHWHLAGMGFTFALSTVVVVWFVARATAALRRRERELAAAREARARDERIVALGNLAASAAHKLGTPLGTLRILIDELERSQPAGAPAREDLALMREQVEHCKQILGGLTADAGALRAEGGAAMPAEDWVGGVVRRWQALRPHVTARLHCDGDLAHTRIVADATLGEALHTLIDNAANADPQAVEIDARLRAGVLQIEVKDRGPGIPPPLLATLGHAPVAPGADGLGIGLFLARATLARLGGDLALGAREGGGTIARLTVPLESIRA
ncbi:HAMP domain-containing histidine kinase [Pseudothauera nasutitermitis]|uniref:histidine kinase n=1 Tax=Pseudothauera nasutitermitis TaxID=2565930 RepID=A0A4V3WCH7_9RHOO|nr:ATP-binding protein [Pseudothauera nasutitermitis]THF67144.1 HAMP domain-containing histidine kinase [Pseudothauera nasutitermitis]